MSAESGARKGRLLLLSIGDGGSPEQFYVVGGARTTGQSYANNPVDVTTKTHVGKETLGRDFGIQQVTVSMDGVYEDETDPRGFVPGDVNITTNVITVTGHTLQSGERCTFFSSGTLPAPLSDNSIYYVVNAVAGDTIQVANTHGGTPIDITTQGTGSHTVYRFSGINQLEEAYLNRKKYNYQLSFRDGLLYQAQHVVEDYSEGGPHDDANTFSTTIRQTGTPTIG